MKSGIYKVADNYGLTEAERQVLEYMLKDIDDVLDKGVREVAQASYTSATTIVELSKKLGHTGYVDMLYRLNFIIKNSEKNQECISGITSFIDEIDKSTIDSFIDNLIKHGKDIIRVADTGFSSPIVDFFCRKMLVLGFKCIKTNSYGIYNNNQIGGALVIGISKGGETESAAKVIDYAAEDRLDVIIFTGGPSSHMAGQSTIHFSILDDKESDDRNITSDYFYVKVIIVMGYLLNKAMSSL